MPSRTEELTGVVRPEVDQQALGREARKVERAFGAAVQDLVPGGRSIGRLVRRLRGAGGGGGGATAGGGGGTSVQMAQLKKLEDIHQELEKIGVGQAKGGGGGGGGGAGGGILAGLGIRALLGGGVGGAAAAAGGAAAAFALPVTIVGMAATISREDQLEALRPRGDAQDRMSFIPPGTGLPGAGNNFGSGFFLTDEQAQAQMAYSKQFDRELYGAANRKVMNRERQFDRELFGAANKAKAGQQAQITNDVQVNVDMSGLANDIDFSDALLDRISKKFTRELEGKIGGGGSTGLRLTNK